MSETKSVQAAWADVMDDVRSLAKGERNAQQGFNFRGVDAVMNATGPALRRHGVSVVPTGVSDVHASTYTTKGGTVMRDVFLVVSYLITGPDGSTMPGAAAGEASDAGDKATPKAMSVAYRTFLLQALTLPTDEPDPDSEVYERAPEPTAQELAAQVYAGLLNSTTEAEAREWGNRAHGRGLLDEQVHGTTLREYVQARIGELAKADQPETAGVPA
jgi:hypothetical protein